MRLFRWIADRIRAAAATLTDQELVAVIGLVLLALGFLVASLPALALGVPGALLVAIALGFNLQRGR